MTRAKAPSITILAAALLLQEGCGAEPPVHFPQSERQWRLQLARPSDDRGLVVPVTIGGSGPYLFLLAPDAGVSTIDRGVAEALDLYTGPQSSWQGFVDHRDREVMMRPYEVLEMRSGELHLRNFVAYGAPAGSLRAGDVPIHGVLGGNLLTRTVIIDIDREASTVTLSITGSADPIDHPLVLAGTTWRGRSPRKLVVDGHIDGLGAVSLAVDLSSPKSALRADRLSALRAPSSPAPFVWRDEFGSETVVEGGKRADLRLGGVQRSIVWTELPDRRLRATDVDGVLGLDALGDSFVRFDPDRRELSLRASL